MTGTSTAADAPRFMTRRKAAAIGQGADETTAAANELAQANTKAWGRLRTLETMVGQHAATAVGSNANRMRERARHLEHVAERLGELLAYLGRARP